MATIKDVAKEANVSTATVSRVLNSNYPVSKSAKIKVLEAVKKLNYHPNAVARSLKNNKTYMIGLVVPDISNSYFMDIARGIESKISKQGYSLIFASTYEDADKEIQLLQALNERRVDAVVLATRNIEAKRINQLILSGLNIIMVDTEIEGVLTDVVTSNDWESSYKLIEYLIQNGHKKISIINGLKTVSTTKARFNAYKTALNAYNIPLDNKYITFGNFNRNIAYASTVDLLEKCKHDLPTAIFSTNNRMTEGALIALKKYKIKIPDQISLVSFGDISVPQLVTPRLTIVKQESFIMGEKVGEFILQKMENNYEDDYKKIVVDFEIKMGQSVKKL